MNQLPDLSVAGRFLIPAAAFVLVIAGLRAASPIVVPFLLAVFISIICSPLLFWLQRKKIPTFLAVLIIISMLLVFGLLLSIFIGSSLNDFLNSLPTYQEKLQGQTISFLKWLQNHGINVSGDFFKTSFNPGSLMKVIGNMLSSLGGLLTNAFMIFLTVLFILLEASSLPQKLRAAMDDPEASLSSFKTFIESVNRYLAIKTLTSLGTGMAVTILLIILDIDYPFLWGMLAFLFNYVPNIGSIIAALPAVLLALIQHGLLSSVLVALGYLVINMVIGNFIEPRYMGQGLGLSTLIVFLSLVFWGWVLGPVGMLLSMPLTMIVKIALESSEETRWMAILLGRASPGPFE